MKRKFVLALAGICMISLTGCKVEYAENMTSEGETQTEIQESSVRVRYSDERFSSYLEFCESEYEKANEHVNVILELVSSENYIQDINSDSTSGTSVPDVYMSVNSDLGTFYLAGLASKNTSEGFTSDNYCDTAIAACSYGENLVAYPLAYETSFLLYNTEFLTKADVKTFEALKAYSENVVFSSEESAAVEAVFKCEINDLFTNYGFISDGIKMGGRTGDDTTAVSLVNDDIIGSAKEYLALIDYFSISSKNTYNGCLKKFKAGNFLSVIATTSSLTALEESDISYGISTFPDYSIDKTTSPLSITTALVVNPYSSDTELAADFASFATKGQADKVYEYSEFPSCKKSVAYENDNIADVYESYAKSTPKNKIMYGEQIYPLLEIALHNIVAGEDIVAEFGKVDEYMKTQID